MLTSKTTELATKSCVYVSIAKANEARRQARLADPDFELSRGRELTAFEKRCMDGHSVYLNMLQSNNLKTENTPSSLSRSTRAHRGTASPRLKQALTEFKRLGGSSYKFCKANFKRFGYASCLGMYSSFRLDKLKVAPKRA